MFKKYYLLGLGVGWRFFESGKPCGREPAGSKGLALRTRKAREYSDRADLQLIWQLVFEVLMQGTAGRLLPIRHCLYTNYGWLGAAPAAIPSVAKNLRAPHAVLSL